MKEQENAQQVYLPTLEELQIWYEEDLRQALAKRSEQANDTILEEGSFFNTFRKLEERAERIPSELIKNRRVYEKYKTYIEEETANMGKKIRAIENCIEYERFFLRWVRLNWHGKSFDANRQL